MCRHSPEHAWGHSADHQGRCADRPGALGWDLMRKERPTRRGVAVGQSACLGPCHTRARSYAAAPWRPRGVVSRCQPFDTPGIPTNLLPDGTARTGPGPTSTGPVALCPRIAIASESGRYQYWWPGLHLLRSWRGVPCVPLDSPAPAARARQVLCLMAVR